jgi:hypothetical protein
MTLTKCKECGKEISNKADACPHCGHKPTQYSGCFLVVIASLAVFGTVGIMSSKTPPAPPPPEPIPTREQIAQDKKKEATRLMVLMYMQALKKDLRDPDSLVWETVRANDNASVICIEYRAKNGFGGMNRDFIAVVNNNVKRDAAAWNKHCTVPLTDHANLRHIVK